jgi:hypothetical protein
MVWLQSTLLYKTIEAIGDVMFLRMPFVLTKSSYTGSKLIGRRGRLMVKTDLCLWYSKHESVWPINFTWNWVNGVSSYDSNFHVWAKDMNALERWTNAFTIKDETVFDPFTGGGTVPAVCKQLNRRYLAFEIDPDTAQMARDRVRNTQPPLFVPENTQGRLFE